MATSNLDDAKLPPMKRSTQVPTDEDDYYMRKIEELANERLFFYHMMEIYEKLHRERLIERPQSTSTGEDDQKKELRDKQVNKRKKQKATSIKRKATSIKRKATSIKRKATSIKRKATSHGEDDLKKKKKKIVVPRKRVRKPLVDNEITQLLKEFIVKEMKGSDLKLVIQKTMFESDTRKGLNRLNMPVNQLETIEFLTEDERRIFSNGEGEKEIEVPLLGPTLEMYRDKMNLRMWYMSDAANYVLSTNWYRFWKENEAHLVPMSTIQVWSFRRDEELCFAVTCVRKPDD